MLKTDANLRDSYKKYKQMSDNPVDIKTYLAITQRYHKYLIKMILDGYEITFPERMGTLSIIGTKRDIQFDDDGKPILPINWPATKKLRDNNPEAKAQKKVVYHTNDHTDGIRYKYLWSKKRIFVENKNVYSMRLTRENKRAVPKALAEGKEYYVKTV